MRPMNCITQSGDLKMARYKVEMYLVCKGKKNFHYDYFCASDAYSAREKAKKHYLGKHYPFCVASFYQRKIEDVEIINVYPHKEVEIEEEPISRADYLSWLDLQDDDIDADIDNPNFARYCC